METDKEAAVIPTFQLENGSFCLVFDALASTYSGGKYEVKNGILTVKLIAGEKYLFKVVDETTLQFEQNGSDKIELTDNDIGIEVSDGDLFRWKK